jgi:hypothetical protein
MQNLSVLTRGNTLRHKVLLLGGPNTFLPFLQECWRKRIPETWDERGYDYPKDVPIEELIPVPDNAALYAAYGAVMYGMHEPAGVGVYTGLDGLRSYITDGRKERLGEAAGPPLARDEAELDQFLDVYRIPKFTEPEISTSKVRAVIESGSSRRRW